MGTVVEFPAQSAQGSAYLEKQLRQLLAAKGADEELIEFASKQLASTYSRLSKSEQYSFSVHFPESLSSEEKSSLQDDINAGLEGIRGANHALLLELVARLLLTEMRLYQEQRQD